MAARVTKQFLANVLQNAKKPVALTGAKGSKTGLLGSIAKNQLKKKQPATQQQSKKVRGGKKSGKASAAPTKKKANERFLDTAKKEQQHADRTEENLRKLRVRPTDKSQRLMAKVMFYIGMARKRMYSWLVKVLTTVNMCVFACRSLLCERKRFTKLIRNAASISFRTR